MKYEICCDCGCEKPDYDLIEVGWDFYCNHCIDDLDDFNDNYSCEDPYGLF